MLQFFFSSSEITEQFFYQYLFTMRDQNRFELDLVNCPADVSDVTD